MLWCAGLFVCINTTNFGLMWERHIVEFHWHSHPRMSDLFQFHDIRFNRPIYRIQKIGHFSGFFVLTLLAAAGTRRARAYWRGVGLAAGYAVLTELLQPYFGRDGRVFDMLVDGAGIALAAVIVYWMDRNRRHAARRQRPYPISRSARH